MRGRALRRWAARVLLEASGVAGGVRAWLDAASARVDAREPCPRCGVPCPSLDVDAEEGCPACQLVEGVREEVTPEAAAKGDARVNVTEYHRKGPPTRPN